MTDQIKHVERMGSKAEAYVHHYPQVIGGVCEFCGVIDRNKPSTEQYKLCSHYKGLELQCSYCDESKNPVDVIYRSTLNITDHPDKAGTMVVVCDAFTCASKHQARFQR